MGSNKTDKIKHFVVHCKIKKYIYHRSAFKYYWVVYLFKMADLPIFSQLTKSNPGYIGINPNTLNDLQIGLPRYGERFSSAGKRGAPEFNFRTDDGPFGSKRSKIFPDQPMETSSFSGFITNPTINVDLIARKFSDDIEYGEQLYQIVLVRKNVNSSTERNGSESWKKPATIFTIPAWNFSQALGTASPGPNDDIPDVNTILNEWAFYGIVRTEKKYDRGQNTSSRTTNTDRLVNSCVFGYVNTFNAWPEAQSFTRLFLIIKKQRIKDGEKYNLVSRIGAEQSVKDIGRRRSEKPFQISYWASPFHDIPPDNVLKYKDEHGRVCRGAYIYIGLAQYGPGPNTKKSTLPAENDTSALVQKPQLHLLTRPKSSLI